MKRTLGDDDLELWSVSGRHIRIEARIGFYELAVKIIVRDEQGRDLFMRAHDTIELDIQDFQFAEQGRSAEREIVALLDSVPATDRVHLGWSAEDGCGLMVHADAGEYIRFRDGYVWDSGGERFPDLASAMSGGTEWRTLDLF